MQPRAASKRKSSFWLTVLEGASILAGEARQQVAEAGNWDITSSTTSRKQKNGSRTRLYLCIAAALRCTWSSKPSHPKSSVTSPNSTTNRGTKCSNTQVCGGISQSSHRGWLKGCLLMLLAKKEQCIWSCLQKSRCL